MTMHAMPRQSRGLMFARNEPSDITKLLNDLNKTFADFKAERDKELAEVRNADVLQTEKVDRINSEISRITGAIDEVNATIAALKAGPNAGPVAMDPDRRAHAAAFNGFFRKGLDAGLRDLEIKAKLTTQSDPDGGYLVPTTMESTIDRVLGTVSALRGLSRVITISGKDYTKLINMGGGGSGWVGEEASRSETSTPGLRQLAFTVGEIYAQPAATQTMLDDGVIDIEQWLADEVSFAFAEQEGAAFISGSGVNKPRGLMTYSTIANGSYSWGNVGYIASGGASDFAATAPADALIDLYHALKQGYRPGATFLMSDATLAKVRKMKDGDGNYLWAPPTVAEQPSTIMGKPVATDDNMPSVGANTFPIAFGDFRRAYLVVDRQGIRVLRDPFTSKPNVLFYTTKRVGGGLQNFEAVKFLKIATS